MLETRKMVCFFLIPLVNKKTWKEKNGKSLVEFDYQNVDSLSQAN